MKPSLQPPLTDRDYADVRHAVLQRIERRRWTVHALQVSFAILAIAVLGIALWPRKEEVNVVKAPPEIAMQQQPSIAATQQPATPRPRNPVTRKRHHRKHAPPPLQPTPLRIELATNDPDVRIIWITNPQESR